MTAESVTPSAAVQPKLLSWAFSLLCAATFLGYAHLSLLTPVLPLFIQAQGGTASIVGLVTAAFSLTSFLLRPFIGRLVDSWSARAVMVVGTAVLGLSSLGYVIYHPVLLFSVRALHGIGWAAYNTGGKVLVSTTAPLQRRGEAAGYFSMAQGLATALLPAVALWLLGLVDYPGIFLISAAGGALAAVAGLAMPPQPQRRAAGPRASFWGSLVERSALLPAGLEFLSKLTQPAAAVFVPLYATEQGIPVETLAYYYLAYGIIGIAARGVLGSWSDRVGRGLAIAAGTAMSAVALVIFSLSGDILALTLAGALFGLGTAAFAPSIMALAIDVADPDKPGAAIATYSMAFQLAVGVGGLVSGLLVDILGFRAMYLIVTLAPIAALGLVFRYRDAISMPKPTSS